MAEKIINNPSLLPGDLAIELSGNAITAISGHPLIGTGGGTQSDYVYYPDFDETTGNIEFKLGTIDNPPSPIGGWHISGADGATGPQGEPGDNGKTPTFQINSENAHWEWKYTDDVAWTDTHVVASGAVGPKGEPGAKGDTGPQGTKGDKGDTGATGSQGEKGEKGNKGDDGISPTVSTSVIDGGNRVTFTYGAGSSTYIDVMSGAPGAPGAKGEDGQKGTDGFSPTVTTSEISPTTQHPQGGTSVTITDSVGVHQFDVWNGLNGQGATVNLLEGTGIQITEDGTDYIIGVSADYALKSELPDVTDFITKDVNNLTYYYKKTETSSTSEITNALSTKLDSTVAEQTYQTKADMTNYLTTSDASTTYQPIGNYATTSDISDMATQTWVGQRGFITKDVNDLTYYYKKTETSGSTELSTEFAKKVNNPDTSLTDKYLVLRTDTNGAVSGWCNFNDKIYSKSESDDRYMQKNTDSTLSGDGTTNSPLGIDSDNFYELDTAGNYLASQTSNQKTIISTTPALDNAVSRVSTSADVWDTVSVKSTVTVNTANNEIKVNNNANSAISAVSYDLCEVGEPDLIPQKMIVGTSSGAFVSYVTGGKCNGMGTLFFWLESQQPWNPVNE